MFTFNNKSKDYFIENLAVLIDSGVNISESLDIIEVGIKDSFFKKKMNKIKEDVEAGFNLWESLDRINVFSHRDISLIKIGENSGNLAENLKILSSQHQKERVFRSKVYSALMYPSIIFFMIIIIGFGMSWFLLPKLALVFSQLDIELPKITEIMISLGLFLQDYGVIFFPIFFVLVFSFFYLIFFHKTTKFLGQSFLFNFFATKRLILESELSRFGFILGTLLGAGFSITESLKSMEQSSIFHFYKKLYKHLLVDVSEGATFRESLLSYRRINKLMPLSVQQIIAVGEKSGKLADSFLKIGKNYEEKLDLTSKNLAIILEPVLLIIVWLGVVFLALSIILPIYGLIGQIN